MAVCWTRAVAAIAGAAALFAVASPAARALDPGDVVVTNRGSNPSVIEIDRATGAQTLITDGAKSVGAGGLNLINSPDGIVAFENRIIVANSGAKVVSVNPATGAQTLLASDGFMATPCAATVGPSGEILIADFNYDSPNTMDPSFKGAVIGVDPVTGAQRLISSNEQTVNKGSTELMEDPCGLEMAPNGELIVADSGAAVSPKVIGVNLATGKQRLITSGGLMDQTREVAFDPAGTMHVLQDQSIVRVDQASGAQTLVSGNAAPAGNPAFQNLEDLVASNGELLVADSHFPGAAMGDGAVFAVNPVTGARSLLSDDTVDGGLFTRGPNSIAVVPARIAIPVVPATQPQAAPPIAKTTTCPKGKKLKKGKCVKKKKRKKK